MSQERLVLVGVDGSPASDAALAWALEVAARTGAEVEAMHAWTWDFGSLGVVVPDAPVALAVAAKTSVETQLEKALTDRAAGAPVVRAHARTDEGDAATVLLAESARSALLVLGRHGRAAWRRRLTGSTLGSVTSHCLNRSAVPVAVVPPDAAAGRPSRIVVGIDGSSSSERALSWAVQHGRAIDAPVVAVLAWQLTSLPAPPAAQRDWAVPPLEDWEAVGRSLLEESVARALDEQERVDVERLLLHRPAAAGLLETAQRDDLLVLGDRGRGGFTRLLLGSVSRQCVEHATGPVVIVPPPERDATGG